MAITVFDGVAKFRSDTTDLEKFTTLLGRVLPTAAQDAAAATLRLKSAKQEFTAAVKEAAQYGGQNEEANKRLSAAEQQLALAARAASAAHTNLNVSLDKNAVALETARMKAAETAVTMGELGATLKGLAMPLLAGAGAFGLGELVKDAQQSVLSLELLSEKTGIAIETLAGLEEVAKQNGISFDEVSTAMVRLARSQTLAIEGGKQQQQAFQRVGISVEELKNLTPEQLFYRLADAMQSAKNPGDAAATAIALLGRGGAALIPILRQGSEALREHIEAASAASGVDHEAGLAAKDWAAQTAELSATFRSVAIPVMETLLPVVKAVETAFRSAGTAVASLLAPVVRTVTIVSDSVIGLSKIVTDSMTGNLKAASDGAKLLRLNLAADFRGFAEDQVTLWSGNAAAIERIWKEHPPTKPFTDDATQATNKAKAAGADLIAAEIEIQSRRLDEKKRAESAALDVEVAMAKLALANQQITAEQELAIEDSANERKYQLDLKLLQDRIALWAKDPTKSAEKAAELNAQIETLEQQHYTKLITDTANYTNQVTKLLGDMAKQVKAATEAADVTLPLEQRLPSFVAALYEAQGALNRFGITTTAQLKTESDEAAADFTRVAKAYDAGSHEYIQAKLKMLEADRALAAAQHRSTTELDAQIKALKAADGELGHLDQRFRNANHDIVLWNAQIKQAGGLLKAFGVDAEDAFMGFSQAFGNAIQQWLLGEASLVDALRKSLAAEFATIAGRAAAWGSYWAAWAIVDAFWNPARAGAEAATAAELFAIAALYGGAAAAINPGKSSGSTGGAGASTETPQAATGAGAGSAPKSSGPVGVVAHGSAELVSQPTLAFIGGTIARTQQQAPMAVIIANPAGSSSVAAAHSSAEPGVEIHIHGGIDNLISTISRRVQRGYATLYSSNSFRTTRRG